MFFVGKGVRRQDQLPVRYPVHGRESRCVIPVQRDLGHGLRLTIKQKTFSCQNTCTSSTKVFFER